MLTLSMFPRTWLVPITNNAKYLPAIFTGGTELRLHFLNVPCWPVWDVLTLQIMQKYLTYFLFI